VNVGSKELLEGLFLLACTDLGVYCLHERCFVYMVITQLQKRAESERKKEERGRRISGLPSEKPCSTFNFLTMYSISA
jgi:hypothetical protein